MKATVSATRSSARSWPDANGFAQRRRVHTHQQSRLRPFPDVRVRTARDGPAPHLVRAEERVGEGEVHPAEQLGIVRGIVPDLAGSIKIRSVHGLVEPLHAPARGKCVGRGSVRHGVDPARSHDEPAHRVLAKVRVVVDPCEDAGVKRLHEQ
jgi:hypothetical protein